MPTVPETSTPLRRAGLAAALALAVAALAAAVPRQEKAERPAPPQDQKQALPDLLKGLEETRGCLGVDAARTKSGKQVIFAWFEDKRAVERWYHSPMHRQVMQLMDGVAVPHPLRELPDDGGPILVVASLTPSAEPKVEGLPMPISQIAIEMYAPLPGGASIGGTFAPKALRIPQHKYDEGEEQAEAKPAAPAVEAKPADVAKP
jgi:quinol monooxygenase YgiN